MNMYEGADYISKMDGSNFRIIQEYILRRKALNKDGITWTKEIISIFCNVKGENS
jgi:hypothetical protein